MELRDAGAVVRVWEADAETEHGYAYTRRQAREIAEALVQVMRDENARLEAEILAKVHDQRPY